MSGRQETRNWQRLINCGELIDVSYEAFDAGVFHPTAITTEAWDRYVAPPEPTRVAESDIEMQRVRVILGMLKFHLAGGGLREHAFVFHVPGDPAQIWLDVACSARDDGRPVITIDLPREN